MQFLIEKNKNIEKMYLNKNIKRPRLQGPIHEIY